MDEKRATEVGASVHGASVQAVRPAWPSRIGMVLAAPRGALWSIARAGGGLADTVGLLFLGVLCLRADDVARALLAYPRAGLVDIALRLLQFFAAAVRDAAWVVLLAAVLLTLLARRGLGASHRNLDLGAACYVPAFAVQAILRVVELAVVGPLAPWVRQGAAILAGAWTFGLFVHALVIVRTRIPQAAVDGAKASGVPGMPPYVGVGTARQRARAGAVGAALLSVLGLSLIANIVWVVRYAEALAPRAGSGGALTFRLPRVDGVLGEIDLSEFDGQVVLIDFWATWCPPCVQMLPSLHALAEKWQPRGVRFVGVHAPDVPRAEIAAFLADRPAPYPIVQDDAEGGTAAQFKVMSLPHLVLLDRKGRIAREFWGYTTQRQLDEAIGKVVASGHVP